MYLKIIILSEVSQQRKTNIIQYHLYVENLKNGDINELIYRAETNLQIQRAILWLPNGVEGREIKLLVWN